MSQNEIETIDKSVEQADIQRVADISRVQAATRPDEVAMQFGKRTTTYQMLDQRANQVANGIMSAGISAQKRIGLLDKNSDTYFELLCGTAKSNTVLVAVNYRLAPPEVAFILNDAQVEMIFVGPEFVPIIEEILPDLPTVKAVYVVDGEHPTWESYHSWRDKQDDTDPQLPIEATDVAMQLYTSGTTGHPKGVQLTNDNLMVCMSGGFDWTGMQSHDVNLVCMPFYHIAGSAWGLIGLYVGCKNLLVREIDPPAILQLIERERITKTLFVPAVILFLTQTPSIKTTDLSSLDLIVYGASPIPVDLLKAAIQIFECDFIQVYGLTETTGAITYLPASDHVGDVGERLRSCGKALPVAEIRVVDAYGNDLPTGEVGEVIMRSSLNMLGYWNLPQATANAIRGEWFYSGDAGYLDADGYLYIHDRIKDMIISGGENIYPAEVESALFEHPAIADVAVIGVPDEKWGEAVKAIVVCRPEAELSVEEIITFARERIAGYKVPRSVDFIETLPRNPSGKILKRELRKPYWAENERQIN